MSITGAGKNREIAFSLEISFFSAIRTFIHDVGGAIRAKIRAEIRVVNKVSTKTNSFSRFFKIRTTSDSAAKRPRFSR